MAMGWRTKSILDELSRRNWLVLDPLSPFRKVVEIEIDGGKTWKVVRLQPVVKQLMAIGKNAARTINHANTIR